MSRTVNPRAQHAKRLAAAETGACIVDVSRAPFLRDTILAASRHDPSARPMGNSPASEDGERGASSRPVTLR